MVSSTYSKLRVPGSGFRVQRSRPMDTADYYHLSSQTSQYRIQFSDFHFRLPHSHFRLQNIPVILHRVKRDYNQIKTRSSWNKLPGIFQPGTLNPWPRPGSNANVFNLTIESIWCLPSIFKAVALSEA